MQFRFFPLRFEFTARDPLYFPPGKAGNLLRGALGTIFRQIACQTECHDSGSCAIRESCPYSKVFEPIAPATGPSGLAYPPRPFVFRARHLEGNAIEPGQDFHFDLNVFSLDPAVRSYFVQTFAALAQEGLGPRRGKADLRCVRTVAVGDVGEQILYDASAGNTNPFLQPANIDLARMPSATPRVRVDFLTPTELKHEHKTTNWPEFAILFCRTRDRISTLRTLYDIGPLDIDFRASNARAQAVRMTRCDVQKREVTRYSTRTGQNHPIGGFVGAAEYEGELAEFLPYLEAGRWIGVGRQVVWGKGEISVSVPEAHEEVTQVEQSSHRVHRLLQR